MDKDLDNKLCQDFPLLYRDRHASMHNTCMCWGFPGTGWYQLLYDLSSKLEPLIQNIVNDLELKGDPECVCGQVRSLHENNKGRCLKIFQQPYKLDYITEPIRKWGHFCIPSTIYDSKKIKDRIYVGYRRLKSYLSNKINNKINKILWFLCDHNILYKMNDSWCKEYKMRHPCASQTKEKYGTLRFYMTSETEEMSKYISEAENLSAKTCEDCGAPGKYRNGGWVATLCDEHAEKHGYSLEENDDDIDE